MTSGEPEALERLRSQFRATFLDDLPGRLDALEALVLANDRAPWDAEAVAEVFRQVHNLKGSSATFGLYPIASLCHQYEDLLSAGRAIGSERKFVDTQLAMIDLVRAVAAALLRGDEAQLRAIEERMAGLRQTVFDKPRTALVVTHARLTRAICREVLGGLGFQVVEAEDSLIALMRLCSESFDLFVASSELAPFNGAAAIAALKLSPRSRRPWTVMITSNREALARHARHADPDVVLELNAALPETLRAAVQGGARNG